MGAKIENKPQVVGTQLEPHSSSVKPRLWCFAILPTNCGNGRAWSRLVKPARVTINFCVPTARDLSNFRGDLWSHAPWEQGFRLSTVFFCFYFWSQSVCRNKIVIRQHLRSEPVFSVTIYWNFEVLFFH